MWLLRYCCRSVTAKLLHGSCEMTIHAFRIVIVVAVVAVIPVSIAAATAPPCDCFHYCSHLRASREAKAVFMSEVTKVGMACRANYQCQTKYGFHGESDRMSK